MLSNINPFVRYIAKTAYFIDALVIARDCRLIYTISGEGLFTLEDGQSFPLLPQSLVYYPCGTPYHISSKDDMFFYTVNFDFINDNVNRTIGIIRPTPNKNELLDLIDEGIPSCFIDPLYVENAKFAFPFLEEIYNESVRGKEYADGMQSAAMKQLLIGIYRNMNSVSKENTICNLIKECVRANPQFNNLQLAQALSYHPYYLNEVFKKNEGESLHKYVMRERVIRARELISESSYSFEEIAQMCGFCSLSHFSRSITAQYGISPAKIRKL